MNGITRDTINEALDRKMFFVFGGLTLIFVIVALLLRNVDINIETNDEVAQGLFVSTFSGIVVQALSSFLTVMFFIAVLSTSGLIPGMFIRGRAEFYLSKPVSRRNLLLGKFFSVWYVYTGIVLGCGMVGLATVYLAHGIFEWSMVWVFATEAVSFFIWSSIVLLGGVLFGSYAMAVVSAFVIWVAQAVLSVAGGLKETFGASLTTYIVDALYYILPKTGQITEIGDNLAMGQSIDSWMPLYSSLIFAGVMILLAVVVFNRRDY